MQLNYARGRLIRSAVICFALILAFAAMAYWHPGRTNNLFAIALFVASAAIMTFLLGSTLLVLKSGTPAAKICSTGLTVNQHGRSTTFPWHEVRSLGKTKARIGSKEVPVLEIVPDRPVSRAAKYGLVNATFRLPIGVIDHSEQEIDSWIKRANDHLKVTG